MIRTRRTRHGFTLVELLVAAAMMILGMWLLTWVYQQGLESFRQARAQSDLTAQQRMVTSLLTRDLTAAHFRDDSTKPNNGRRLSDQRTDLVWSGGYTPPTGGYFRAGSTPVDVVEASADGFTSSRSFNHFLQFTSILPGGPSHQVFSAEVPAYSGTQYFSTAAEVAYFLQPSGQTTGGGAVTLYDLYRQQRIVARNTDDAPAYNAAATTADAPEVMVVSGGQMRTLRDLTVPAGLSYVSGGQTLTSPRLSGPPFTRYSFRVTEDKLMSNVLSFEVKFTGNAGYNSGVTWPRPYADPNTGAPLNTDFPYDTLPSSSDGPSYDGRFDTHSPLVAWQQDVAGAGVQGVKTLKPIRITGVMIRLRSYDTRTNSARQTTLTLDL